MATLIFQLQLLLAGLTALAPLLPTESRGAAEQILDSARRVLAAAVAVGARVEDIARQYAALRAELAAVADNEQPISSEQFSVALARVQSASAALRAALRDAEAGG